MATFFSGFETVETVKAEYRRLAKVHHPDHGGDEMTMKRLNSEYESALKNLHGSKSTGSDGKQHTYWYDEEVEAELMAKIYDLLKLKMEGVEIALIGKWIWVQGNTRPYSAKLNKSTGIGMKWCGERQCWYWRSDSQKCYKRTGADLSYLAMKYGYQGFAPAKESDVAQA